MIEYTTTTDQINPDQLAGFFVGWPNPPSAETHLRILKAASHIALAIDDDSGNVIGFINAISDGILSAYIPLLEVLPGYKKQGIGKELVMQILKQLNGVYMIDLTTDRELQPWYEKLGMKKSIGMMIRNFDNQNGKL